MTCSLDSLWLQENSSIQSSFHYPCLLWAFFKFTTERRAPKWDQGEADVEEPHPHSVWVRVFKHNELRRIGKTMSLQSGKECITCFQRQPRPMEISKTEQFSVAKQNKKWKKKKKSKKNQFIKVWNANTEASCSLILMRHDSNIIMLERPVLIIF